ncbi:MAG: GNAT family N-acetyltransferase [Tumebacillaceae bacterium]
MTTWEHCSVDIEQLSFEALDDRHDLQGFTCGNSSIDTFFLSTAYYDQALGLSQTTVVIYHEQVVGFYSARCTKIEIRRSEAGQLGLDELYVQAIEVPFLGVHKNLQKKGIGKELLEFIIADVTEIAERVGCKFLFLQALNEPDLIAWYTKHGFRITEVEGDNDRLAPMRMPIMQRVEFPEY